LVAGVHKIPAGKGQLSKLSQEIQKWVVGARGTQFQIELVRLVKCHRNSRYSI
jgi:hypothetical protein